jgi:hypothetical protein
MEFSSFGRLSGELRNMIYNIALREGDDGSGMIELKQANPDSPFHTSNEAPSIRNGSIVANQKLQLGGLPSTCRQARQESLRLYYALNRFYIETSYLRSPHKDRIIARLAEWAHGIGPAQAREIRDVTVDLTSVKGHPAPVAIRWEHMRKLRSLFHPRACVRIRFFLDGSKTASFVLGERGFMWEQLDCMVELWYWRWRRTRRYSEGDAREEAERCRQEVAKLLVDMPEFV